MTNELFIAALCYYLLIYLMLRPMGKLNFFLISVSLIDSLRNPASIINSIFSGILRVNQFKKYVLFLTLFSGSMWAVPPSIAYWRRSMLFLVTLAYFSVGYIQESRGIILIAVTILFFLIFPKFDSKPGVTSHVVFFLVTSLIPIISIFTKVILNIHINISDYERAILLISYVMNSCLGLGDLFCLTWERDNVTNNYFSQFSYYQNFNKSSHHLFADIIYHYGYILGSAAILIILRMNHGRSLSFILPLYLYLGLHGLSIFNVFIMSLYITVSTGYRR